MNIFTHLSTCMEADDVWPLDEDGKPLPLTDADRDRIFGMARAVCEAHAMPAQKADWAAGRCELVAAFNPFDECVWQDTTRCGIVSVHAEVLRESAYVLFLAQS
jgi:hypothetical protein